MHTSGLADRTLSDRSASPAAAGRKLELLSPRQGYAKSMQREGDGLHLPSWPYVLEPAVRIVR